MRSRDIIDLSKINYTVRAEPVEALLPFDKACPELDEGLRANGIKLSPIMESSINTIMPNKRLRNEMYETARGLYDLGVMNAETVREFDAQAWDRQIAADLRTGKPDSLINEARAEFKAGKTRKL